MAFPINFIVHMDKSGNPTQSNFPITFYSGCITLIGPNGSG